MQLPPSFANMKLNLFLLVAALRLEPALAAVDGTNNETSPATSWEGELPYDMYDPNSDGCSESNKVAFSGTTTALHSLDDNVLCETDIFGEYTIYTK